VTWDYSILEREGYEPGWVRMESLASDAFPRMAPLVLLTPTGSKALFSNSGRSPEEIYKTPDLGRVQTFQLPLTATIRGSSRHENLRSAMWLPKSPAAIRS
jgi:hypothetical protein